AQQGPDLGQHPPIVDQVTESVVLGDEVGIEEGGAPLRAGLPVALVDAISGGGERCHLLGRERILDPQQARLLELVTLLRRQTVFQAGQIHRRSPFTYLSACCPFIIRHPREESVTARRSRRDRIARLARPTRQGDPPRWRPAARSA